MAYKVPSALKLSQLKQIAYKCGISSSGTKPVLSQRLIDEISGKKKHGAQRVLSIDMGIRNLAYCVLDLPSKSEPENPMKHGGLPSIVDWRRITFMPAPSKTLPTVKEAFDPGTMSAAACKLVRERLLASKPSKVLIERQRFRSMGSPHILEWTVRVNMLESMIYAILETLKMEGNWSGEVVAIAPGKVGPFWVGEDETKSSTPGEAVEYKKKTKSQFAKIRNKGLKMDLVRKWLQERNVFLLGNEEVECTATAYMEKWDRTPGQTKTKKGKKGDGQAPAEEMGKLDDLADCLLQGLAWQAWENNRELVRTQGVEILLDDPVVTPKKTNTRRKSK